VVETSQPTVLELWDVVRQPSQLLRRFDHLGGLQAVLGPGHFTTVSGGVASPSWSGSGTARSPDGKVLAFRPNGRLVLWDLANRHGGDKAVDVAGFEGEWIAFSPDGSTLLTYKDAKEGTVITLWDLPGLISRGR